MLTPATLDKLPAPRLTGMAKGFEEQRQTPGIKALSAEEHRGRLVDRELAWRKHRRLTTRLAIQRPSRTCAFRYPRGLDQALLAKLATCQWLREHPTILITSPTGIGTSWVACALAPKACREGFSVLSLCLPRFLQELAIAKSDGRYAKLLAPSARTDLLVLDDVGAAPPPPRRAAATCLRCSKTATTCALHGSPASSPSKLARGHWPSYPRRRPSGPPRTHPYKLTLKEDSLRKRRALLTPTEPSEASSTPASLRSEG
jgi:hypothetical protein